MGTGQAAETHLPTSLISAVLRRRPEQASPHMCYWIRDGGRSKSRSEWADAVREAMTSMKYGTWEGMGAG